MQGIQIDNYMYRNTGTDRFENKIKEWGLGGAGFSNGAVYADLDNDGDLDLITNNIEEEAGVYRNNSEIFTKNNFLRIKLKGDHKNGLGIGAKLYGYAGGPGCFIWNNCPFEDTSRA